ncbi:MAG: TIM barrel protein [Candidatus Nanohaloarchaea archaeon]|nr:TIM barrel protein [Candidatus Nanohaloarchaea archaeon]
MTQIGVATGCFYQTEMAFTEQLQLLKEIGADGIEVTFGNADEVHAFEAERWKQKIRSFNFRTVHAPIRSDFQRDQESKSLLRDIETIREQIDAQSVVFHPDRVDDATLLGEITQPAIENMQERKEFNRDDFSSIMEAVDAPVVIDICHAATWENQENRYMFENFGDRTSHVHVSALGENTHEPLHKQPSFLTDELVSFLEGHNLIIELRDASRNEIQKEITFLRDRLT